MPFDTDTPSRRGWLRPALIVAGLVIVAAVLYLTLGREGAAGGGQKPAAETQSELPTVTVVVPGRSAVATEVRATGSISARRTSPVGVQGEGGLVTAVLVKEGDFVRRGQVLARIDRAVQEQQVIQMQAGIRQAQADAALAQAELDRAQQLVARGFISKADIDRKTAARDSARARVDVARAQTGEMQARIARMDVRAPTDGLILTRSVEAGQVVGPGSSALFTMAQDAAVEMRALVAEQDLPLIRAGQPATVQLVGSDVVYRGTVWLKEPIIDPQTRQGIVRIALASDSDLRPGGFARASVTAGSADRPVLPQSAVLSDDDGSFVYVVGQGNKILRRPVSVAQVSDQGLAIASGLDGSEKVVASAGAFLNPGETIKPVLKRAS